MRLVRAVRTFITAVVAALIVGGGGDARAASYPAYADMGSAQAVEIGDRILSWQLAHGGWGKDLPIATTMWTPGTPKSLQQAGGVELGSFDNGATTTEMRYLAHVYAATEESRFHEGFLMGLDFILAAQYPTGGWPQVYPRRGDYADQVTFNDDAMVHVMQLLWDVAKGGHPFGFVDEARRAASERAFFQGIEYILEAQIEVDGRLTAWCAQHDPWTYEPRAGRSYEHPSISGAESVGIVRLLMALPDPDERIQRAILSALLWLEEARLPDGRWARFYELGTNRPIFSGRDGIVRYDLAEVEAERRHGYAWYGTWPQELLRQAWSEGWMASLHAALPDFETPLITIVHPPEGARVQVKGELAVELALQANDPEAIGRVLVSLDSETIYDDEKVPDPGELVIDTTQLEDGRRTLEVVVEYGDGKRVVRRREVVVRNWWERRIAMRAPEDLGWFGVVDHLGASDRSDGWEFLVDRTDPPFGITYRLRWQAESDEFLIWPATGLRGVELLVLSPAHTAEGVQIEVGADDPVSGERRWRKLGFVSVVEREEDGWSLLRLVAEAPPVTPQGDGAIEWLRISVQAEEGSGPLEIGELLIRGIS